MNHATIAWFSDYKKAPSRRTGLKSILNDVEKYAEKLQERSYANEDVEDGVHISFLLSESVDHGADGVGDTARQKQNDSPKINTLDRLFPRKNDAPAKTYIADHRKDLEPLNAQGVRQYSEGGNAPDHAENDPTRNGINGAYSRKRDRRVGARNKQEDRAMVDNAEDLFCGQMRVKSVVDA